MKPLEKLLSIAIPSDGKFEYDRTFWDEYIDGAQIDDVLGDRKVADAVKEARERIEILQKEGELTTQEALKVYTEGLVGLSQEQQGEYLNLSYRGGMENRPFLEGRAVNFEDGRMLGYELRNDDIQNPPSDQIESFIQHPGTYEKVILINTRKESTLEIFQIDGNPRDLIGCRLIGEDEDMSLTKIGITLNNQPYRPARIAALAIGHFAPNRFNY